MTTHYAIRVVALVCLALLLPVSAGGSNRTAAAPRAPFVALSIAPNGGGNRLDVVVHVLTGQPRISCEGVAKHAGWSTRLPRLRTGRDGGRQWHWYVGAGTPRAKLTVRAECTFPDGKVHRRRTARMVGPGPYPTHVFREAIRAGSLHVEAWIPGKRHDGSGQGGSPLYPRGQCTWYVARLRPDLPYFLGESGDARNWIRSAKKYRIPTGRKPRIGAVAVFRAGQYGAGYYGHVAYVIAVHGDMITLMEANYHGRRPGTRRTIAWQGVRFIYRDTAAPDTPSSSPKPAHPPSSPSSPSPSPSPSPSAPSTPTPTPEPEIYDETTGGDANSWTNYTNAGGTQGPTIPAHTTVKISCKVSGFKVADGNTWWYRIASPPWNNVYYSSADAFYNNGQTSGSLVGTPLVDDKVPDC